MFEYITFHLGSLKLGIWVPQGPLSGWPHWLPGPPAVTWSDLGVWESPPQKKNSRFQQKKSLESSKNCVCYTSRVFVSSHFLPRLNLWKKLNYQNASHGSCIFHPQSRLGVFQQPCEGCFEVRQWSLPIFFPLQ